MAQNQDSQDIFLTIIHAQAAYARTIDNDDLEHWPDFFTEDCLYKITTASNMAKGYEVGVVYANSRGMVKDRISALREANIYEKHTGIYLGCRSSSKITKWECEPKLALSSCASCTMVSPNCSPVAAISTSTGVREAG